MPPLRFSLLKPLILARLWGDWALLTELAKGLVREYACKYSVVVGPPLSNGKAAAARARSWMPVRGSGTTAWRFSGQRALSLNPNGLQAVPLIT